MKSEPNDYSIDDLARDNVESWVGVRNYEARNMMRHKTKVGDRAFIDPTDVRPSTIAGEMDICSEPYPDSTQSDPGSKYFDEKSSESDPRWQLVDVKFVRKFETPVSRDELKEHEDLLEMQLFKRNRLSITRVTESEYNKILKLAGL